MRLLIMSHVIVVCRSVIFYLVEEALENTNEETKAEILVISRLSCAYVFQQLLHLL
jgi:hypothetical protein